MASSPDPGFVTDPPDGRELRSLRRLVDGLHGEVLPDRHEGRAYRIKQAPGKFKSVTQAMCQCGQDGVICDIPTVREGGENDEPDPPIMRICLVCDAGREMLGLNGKPLA